MFILATLLTTNLEAKTEKKLPLPDKIIFAYMTDDLNNKGLNNNPVLKLAKILDVQIELYPCPWARCLKLIENGKADIIDDLFFTEERARFIYYLKPNVETQTSGFHFYSSTHKINSLSDLNNLRVAYLRGYTHYPQFDDSKAFDKVPLPDLKNMVNMMLAKRIDVFIADPSFPASEISNYDPQLTIKKQRYSHIEDMPIYLGVSKKSQWMSHKAQLESALIQFSLIKD